MNKKINMLTKLSVLTALAVILYMIEIPLFFGHLKVDPSLIPSVVASLTFGPIYGLVVEFLKNLLHLPITSSAGIGELINFLVGVSVIIPISLIYKKSTKTYVFGFIISIISIVSVGALLNYLLTPAYLAVYGRVDVTQAEVLTYVVASVSLNLVKVFVTLIPTYFLLPVINKLKNI